MPLMGMHAYISNFLYHILSHPWYTLSVVECLATIWNYIVSLTKSAGIIQYVCNIMEPKLIVFVD